MPQSPIRAGSGTPAPRPFATSPHPRSPAAVRALTNGKGAALRWMGAISSPKSRGGEAKSLTEAAGYIQDGIGAELSFSPRERKLANSNSVYKCLPECRQRIGE